MVLLAFQPVVFARFALSEFQRGIDGLSEQDARVQMKKADGTFMNSIAHTIGHLSWHWLAVRRYATEQPYPDELRQFAFGAPPEETPPPLSQVLAYFDKARSLDWLEGVDEAFLDSGTRQENIGTSVTRVTLHTWYHTGEVNAIRQMLGHPEITFVGPMIGQLEPAFRRD